MGGWNSDPRGGWATPRAVAPMSQVRGSVSSEAKNTATPSVGFLPKVTLITTM